MRPDRVADLAGRGNRHGTRGQPVAVIGFTVRREKIVEIGLLANPARLGQLDLTLRAARSMGR
jgi:hypothetical protein